MPWDKFVKKNISYYLKFFGIINAHQCFFTLGTLFDEVDLGLEHEENILQITSINDLVTLAEKKYCKTKDDYV